MRKLGEICFVLLSLFSVVDDSIEAKEKLHSYPFYCEDKGLKCRIDSEGGYATIETVGKILNYTLPSVIEYNGKEYKVASIGSDCKWPENELCPDSLIIPEGYIRIGENAFRNYPCLRKIVLPETIKEIGKRAFAYTDLEQITIPPLIEIIEIGVFEGCRNLTEVNMPDKPSIEGGTRLYILNKAFKGCAIPILQLPKRIKMIGRDAFEGCPLTYLEFRNFKYCQEMIQDFKAIFGKDEIPWIAGVSINQYSHIPGFDFFAFIPSFSQRTVLRYKNQGIIQYEMLNISFEETGDREMQWPEGEFWPLTDTTKPASRPDYVSFAVPIKVSVDKGILKTENISDPIEEHIIVKYNGEDITSQLIGDTIILTEGFPYKYPEGFRDEESGANYLEIYLRSK